MRRVRVAILAVLLSCFLISCAGAVSMTIDTSEKEARIGDVIRLHGTVTGIKTIAVYLYLTGPGLNPRGVTLENINAAAGGGLFTTAPVDMATGEWTYDWDTSVILGTLKPGKYTVYATYAMTQPLGRVLNTGDDYATAEIEFLPPEVPANDVPVPLCVPFLAVGIVAGILAVRQRDAGT